MCICSNNQPKELDMAHSRNKYIQQLHSRSISKKKFEKKLKSSLKIKLIIKFKNINKFKYLIAISIFFQKTLK